MIQKLPIKTICAAVLLIFVVWLWQVTISGDSGSDASLVSSITPVGDVQAQSSDVSSRVLLVGELDEQLASRLNATTQLIDDDQVDKAVSELKAIIDAQPEAVEPYINLAALYAKSKNIELARDTLLDGIKVNKNTAVLFDSLQKVYAAQASLSYQRALEIETVNDDSLVLSLPKIDTLSLKQPSKLEAELKKSNRILGLRVADLEKDLSVSQVSIESLKQEKNTLNSVNADLKKQQQDNESSALLALKSDNNRLSEQVANINSERKKLQLNIQALQEENTQLSLTNTDLNKSASLKVDAKTKLDQQLLSLKTSNVELEERLAKTEQARSQLQSEMGSLQSKNEELVLANNNFESTVNQQLSTVSSKQQAEAKLQSQLAEVSEKLVQSEKRYRDQLAKLERDSDDKVQALTAKNEALELANNNFESTISQQQSAVSSNQQSEAKLQSQLASTKQKLVESEKRYNDQLAKLERDADIKIKALQAQLAKVQSEGVVASVTPTPKVNEIPESKPQTEQISREQLNQTATGLVQAWAGAWAEQDVPSYISRYVSDFRPSSGISHKQWREQRRVRLTNKTFIKVDVSNFSVTDQGDKFAVKFVQHYRSNNVDDRIFKQLVFLKSAKDWSDAKIVAEQVLTQ